MDMCYIFIYFQAALQPVPNYLRSSTRPWPYRDAHRWPGLHLADIDGDGRILSMRIADPHGAWVEHPEDSRVMIPFDHPASPYQQTQVIASSAWISQQPQRYRILREGTVQDYDGFTIPTPYTTSNIDCNRNFPAFWGKEVKGSGDHALSEPEIFCLVRALTARPNVCGYNAYHTNGGFLIRPSGVKQDSDVSHVDIWVWDQVPT